jgi:decaprenyl-phosphate phosphoribosyltransferase
VIKEWFHILRIKHWIKNLFVITPAFFSALLIENYLEVTIGFISFCFLASSIYIINDIKDRGFDKNNPSKRVSSVSSTLLYSVSVMLALASIVIGLYLGSIFPLLIYLIVNLLYTYKLKEIPYLEMLLVSSGFLLRVIFGGQITSIPITPWLYSEVAILTIIIVLAKRIKELNFYIISGTPVRKVISSYSPKILNSFFYFLCAIIIGIYVFYCFDNSVIERTHKHIWLTIPFVVLGVFRFIQLTKKNNKLLNPINILLQDYLLLLATFGWVLTWLLLYYYG